VKPGAFRRALLGWYDRHRRDLPWRRTRDPYRVWVSEVMLQQTTVAAVVPYYHRFLQRFPDLPSLAAASEEDVLTAWSGLGYYRRARQLRAGARALVETHGGLFPGTLDGALGVPGVGPYTARAVLSIAGGQPLAVVDGNVRRVLARLRAREALLPAEAQELADDLLDTSRPGDWNQAVMELGATVCTPRSPACGECPVSTACAGHRAGDPTRYPAPLERRAPRDVVIAAAVVEQDGRVLFVRRRDARLMDGLWEIPQTSIDGRAGKAQLARELQERHGLRVRTGRLLVQVRHAVTFRRLRVDAYRATLAAPPPTPDTCWLRPDEIGTCPMSSLSAKIVRALP
jgi:A/G-specific adenine glycosylase